MAMIDFNIELATSNDLNKILELRRLAILKDAPSAMPNEKVILWANKKKNVEIKTQIDCYEIWVARLVSDDLLGWVRVKSNRIEALYVAEKYMRNGIGRTLLNHAEKQLLKNGFQICELEAAFNATPFYQQCGYRKSSIQRNTDSLSMEKVIYKISS